MNDATNPQVSGDPESDGELPTPSFSSESGSSPSVDADAIVSKLTPILEQLVERKVQSTKDKRFSELEKALGGRSKLLAELKELGQDVPKDVLSELRIRELEERLAQPDAQPARTSDNGLSQPKAAVTEAIAELQKYGLEQNDPAFIELLRGKYASKAEFDNKVLGHIVTKLAPPKPANVADVTQSPAAARTTEKSPEAQISEYKKEMLAARGKPAELNAIKNKYVKMGVDIHQVDFT